MYNYHTINIFYFTIILVFIRCMKQKQKKNWLSSIFLIKIIHFSYFCNLERLHKGVCKIHLTDVLFIHL